MYFIILYKKYDEAFKNIQPDNDGNINKQDVIQALTVSTNN